MARCRPTGGLLVWASTPGAYGARAHLASVSGKWGFCCRGKCCARWYDLLARRGVLSVVRM
jgi:hypothetical protein